MALFDNIDPTQTGNNSDSLKEGFHSRCRLLKAKLGKGQVSNRPYVSFKVEILESDNPAAVGTVGDFFEQLEGARFPSYDRQAQARTLQFVGALFGLSAGETKGKVGAKEVGLVCDDATQPMTNRIVSVRAKKVATTQKGDDIMRCETFPVLENGQPAVFSEGTQTRVKPIPSAPVAPVSKFTPENGYWPHPSAPGHVYNAAQEVFSLATGLKVG